MPSGFFGDITGQKSYATKRALYLLQTLPANGVLVYRCFIVWHSICQAGFSSYQAYCDASP
ncbi:hypothetical protein DFJ58DRAFT_651814 [Suillus subalutaceus]|uniref:uncharacterized protein n=1 Tax=Suillus subalutaceus TaxID=48586 RepID=UPI001B87ABD9|nr:uncharacterized protein DFJ58DRAFT_651814 [Suillus subalutaceus]KAG1873067.1 hypothetical protein DFJ58DRAFT_651814 [Suillus subalutaceus]